MLPFVVAQPMIKTIMVAQLISHVDVTHPKIIFFGHLQAEEFKCDCLAFVFIIIFSCFFDPFDILATH